MACEITRGRGKSCRDNVAGLKALYILNEGTLRNGENVTLNTDSSIADITGTFSAYKFLGELLSNSNTITTSRDNGTTTYNQVVNFYLAGISAEDNELIQSLATSNPQVIIEDNNGKFQVIGLTKGCILSGTSEIGANMGDKYGYTLTLTADDRYLPNFLPDAVPGNPFEGLTATVTIVEN